MQPPPSSSSELSQLLADKEKELSESLETQMLVEDEILKIQKSVIELHLKKKDLEIAASKGKYNIKQLQIEIKIVTNRFWSAKNSGI